MNAFSLAAAVGCLGTCLARHSPAQEPGEAEVTGTFRLAGGVAIPGGAVRVPFVVRSSHVAWGFTVSLDFDETVMEAVDVEGVFQRPGGRKWDYFLYYFESSDLEPGSTNLTEGFVTFGGLFDLHDFIGPPPETAAELVAIHFKVKLEAQVGPTTPAFVDGAPSDSTRRFFVRNELGSGTKNLVPQFEVAPIVVVDAGSVFVRGDSNADGTLDISDALRTLSFLFLDGEPLRCLDAADTNDDGRIDVSDPVHALTFLFLEGPPPPPPGLAKGPDPTTDDVPGACFGDS